VRGGADIARSSPRRGRIRRPSDQTRRRGAGVYDRGVGGAPRENGVDPSESLLRRGGACGHMAGPGVEGGVRAEKDRERAAEVDEV
jgi:hypothetical protein